MLWRRHIALAICMTLSVALGVPAAAREQPWELPIAIPHTQILGSMNRNAFLSAGIIYADFAKPAQNWLPGHRGIDLMPTASPVIYAPAPGTIGFTGKVAGKPVVTVLHAGGVRSTFEPADTDLEAGTLIVPGAQLGTISPAGPWHCPTACLHWGVKRGNDYLDPWRFINPHVRIILLPARNN